MFKYCLSVSLKVVTDIISLIVGAASNVIVSNAESIVYSDGTILKPLTSTIALVSLSPPTKLLNANGPTVPSATISCVSGTV